MRASVLVLVIAACGGSSPKPAPVVSAPPPSPAATPELPKEQPKDEPAQVAKGGDPCEGGEVTNTIGESAGAPGGTGAGGGGAGESTTGIGTIGTIGHGSGTGSGTGAGGSTHFGNTKGPEPTVTLGAPIVKGPLDKEIVRRIVRRHISEVKYCYELQLQTRPDLAGTVQTQFTINGDGTVDDAAAGGVDDKVSACIAKRIKAWEFPKPKNGAVLVNYPMTLSTRK